MQYKIKSSIIVVISFILIACFNTPVKGENQENLAVILVIDTSGSMADTDPDKLRQTASDIFIDLLSSEDYVGIVTFDNNVTMVQPLSKVQNYNNKVNMKNNLIPHIVASGDTNYKKALDEAANQLSLLNDDNVNKAILLITDGEPDPDSARTKESGFIESYMETLWQTVDHLIVNQYPVYSVGFSDGIRSDILDQISNSTGGNLQILDDANSLVAGLFKTLGELKNQTNFIHETMNLSNTSSIDIPLDKSINKETILIIDEDESTYKIEMVNPHGEIENKAFNIEKYNKYTIITLNQDGNIPYGNWKLNIKGSGKVQLLGNKRTNINSITNMNSSATVPLTLVHDFFIKEEGYRVGERIGVTSSLTSGGIRLKSNSNLVISSYNMVFNHEDGTTETFSLYDDGQKEHNDLVADDGIWSNNITFSKESVSNAFMIATGRYNNKSFVAENKIGIIHVSKTGRVNISFTKESEANPLIGVKGSVLSIPLIIENNSDFTENLYITLEGNIGILQHDQITLKPGETKETAVEILIDSKTNNKTDNKVNNEANNKNNSKTNDKASSKTNNIKISFQTEQDFTTLNIKSFTKQVEIISEFQNFFIGIKSMVHNFKTFFIIFIIMLVLFIIVGRILNYKLCKSRKAVNGVLIYHLKNNNSPVDSGETFCIPSINKEKVIISFNEKNSNADFYIRGTIYNYEMIITADYKSSKFKFIDGWKVLFQNKFPIRYILCTTAPGIIEKEGGIFTSIILKDDEEFESGGFLFRYFMPLSAWSKEAIAGRNILEGKYGEGINKKYDKE